MLKLMYITNRPDIAQIAETAGVDRIFVDMEFIGKDERQKGLDTVKSRHTFLDIANIKQAVEMAEVLARINPIHDPLPDYPGSAVEIDRTIAAGADIIMLPYFKTPEEVRTFLKLVNGRARTMLLLETREAVEHVDEILFIPGIDEIHIGINDLSISYGKRFMFELLADGTVEQLCFKFRKKGIPFGFGGIASLGNGLLPSEYVIKEHYRLGSTCVILSRSFCDVMKIHHIGIINDTFLKGVRKIRELEQECAPHSEYFRKNQRMVEQKVAEICADMAAGRLS
ncbi:MAG: aldolase/citrate lyase family protein [Candidatus Faecousia sp.]|nr:aldolase/citrate lyase family protein [Candidatus Faecousia sp.]